MKKSLLITIICIVLAVGLTVGAILFFVFKKPNVKLTDLKEDLSCDECVELFGEPDVDTTKTETGITVYHYIKNLNFHGMPANVYIYFYESVQYQISFEDNADEVKKLLDDLCTREDERSHDDSVLDESVDYTYGDANIHLVIYDDGSCYFNLFYTDDWKSN